MGLFSSRPGARSITTPVSGRGDTIGTAPSGRVAPDTTRADFYNTPTPSSAPPPTEAGLVLPDFYEELLSGSSMGLGAAEAAERATLGTDIEQFVQKGEKELERGLQRKGMFTSTLDVEGREQLQTSAARALAAGTSQIMGRYAGMRSQQRMMGLQLTHQAVQGALDRGLKREELELAREQARQQGNMELWNALGSIIPFI